MRKHNLLPVYTTEQSDGGHTAILSASTDAFDIEQFLMYTPIGSIEPGSTNMQQQSPEASTFEDLIKDISAPPMSYLEQLIAECVRSTPAHSFPKVSRPEPVGNPVSTSQTDEIWLQDTFILRAAPKPREHTTGADLPVITQLLEYRRPDHEHYSAMIGAVMAHLQTHKNLPEVLVIHSSEIAAYTGAIAQHEGMYAGVMHYWGTPVRLLTERDVPEWVRVLLDASIIPVGMIFSAA